ncbi:MAG: hypothetical protein OXC53_06820, partial [Rhodobacteraceae bacterium]|nr:hypothetical protein [Paracoccaceae bacterium]
IQPFHPSSSLGSESSSLAGQSHLSFDSWDELDSLADIPQVAFRPTSRSPDFVLFPSVFCRERGLWSRKGPKLGEWARNPAISQPDGDVFQRGGQTCPAAFVRFGRGWRSRG